MKIRKLSKIIKKKPKYKYKHTIKRINRRLTVLDLKKNGHKGECVCCGSKNNLTFDHKVPSSKGGWNSVENGQVLCKTCNQLKDDRIIGLSVLKQEIKLKNNEDNKSKI